MKWIIFQAVPTGEQQYQMYVAPLMFDVKEEPAPAGTMLRATPLPNLTIPKAVDILRIGEPIRISPANSRNTCGFFSPDGNSLIFASTAGKENPEEPGSGYVATGRELSLVVSRRNGDFSCGRLARRSRGRRAGEDRRLAKHPLTNNNAYDAECSYSPDGNWICYTSKVTGDLELYAMRPRWRRGKAADAYPRL